MRKTYSNEYKFKVAIEAIRGNMTIAQLVSRFQVAESLIHTWHKQLLDQGCGVFDGNGSSKESLAPVDVDKLHAKIGQLTLERDFLERALSKVR